MPLHRLTEGIDKFDEWFGVYPLLVFPVRYPYPYPYPYPYAYPYPYPYPYPCYGAGAAAGGRGSQPGGAGAEI